MIYIEKQKLTDDVQSHKNIYIRVEASLTRQTAPDDMHNIFRLEYDMYYVGKPCDKSIQKPTLFFLLPYIMQRPSSQATPHKLSFHLNKSTQEKEVKSRRKNAVQSSSQFITITRKSNGICILFFWPMCHVVDGCNKSK
jgi:hypothetical protein